MNIEEFYESKFYFSYSSISTLLYNPLLFYNSYILGKKETNLNSLVEGRLIHTFILEPDKFKNKFIINKKLPNVNAKKVIDKIFTKYYNTSDLFDPSKNLKDYSSKILLELKEEGLHQKLLTDQQRLDKILIDENIEYFEYLIEQSDKTVITQETYDKCFYIASKLKNEDNISDLLKINNDDSNIKVYNELELMSNYNSESFGLRGVIDNLVIDHVNKKIIINDLKTTSKTLIEFPQTVEIYSYWMQVVIYSKLVIENFKELIDDSYKLYFNFVVVDKNQQVYTFEVSRETFEVYIERFNNEVLKKVKYHYYNKKFNLPYDLCVTKFKL